MAPTNPLPRLHCLDWIRVIAFGALIIYHIECFYSEHWVVTSAHRVEQVDALMLATHPWRTMLLFVVAGAALRLMQRRTPRFRLGRQVLRLGAPLVIGAVLFVPPQFIVAGGAVTGPDWSAARWLSIIRNMESGDLQHVWFIAYLLAYTVFWVAAFPLVKGLVPAFARALAGWGIFVWPLAVLTALRAFAHPLFGETLDIANDWYVHGISLAAFIFGFALAGAPPLWAALVERRTLFLACATFGYAGLAFGEAFSPLFYALLQWGAIAAVLGYGARLLNRESATIRYLNRGVLTAFLVHQPIIVVLGFYLIPLRLPLALEAGLLLGATIIGALLSYEAVRCAASLSRRAKAGLASIAPAAPTQAARI